MSRKSIAPEKGRILFENVICDPKRFPLSFTYGGKKYRGLGEFECIENCRTDTEWHGVFSVDEELHVRVEAKLCPEFGQAEYTVWFENRGGEVTDILEDMAALDGGFDGGDPVVRGIMGDIPHQYAPHETVLSEKPAHLESLGGRATHGGFPYFDLVHGDGGTLIALGWAGTWDADFEAVDSGARAKIRSIPGFRAVLLPGESVRTGLVVLLPYAGRNQDDAMNLWREWFLKYNLPRANGNGDPIKPFVTSCFAADTGLPNSDGSISERDFTWKPTLDKLIAEDVVPDFRWFDAGWYFDPAGNTVPSDWKGTIGSWELDREKWPGMSFRESIEEGHKHGMKTLVWFEPERTTHVDDLAKNYGYDPAWAIATEKSITNNIGDPACLEWTTKRIIHMMDENAVDLYREDNNANHNLTWKKLDGENTEKLGRPRYGVAENNSICGHYRLWDNILEYCARTGKCTYTDSCASGGGRNDIESLRRGVPFMRSDYDRTTIGLRLSMSTTFNKWVPFHGSSSKETEGELDSSVGAGSDGYAWRASYLPILNHTEAYVHNPELDYGMMRKYIGEWRSLNHLLLKDMYVLTPWHDRLTLTGWTAWAYDDPEAGESVLMGFRMEECQDAEYTVKLPYAVEGAEYIFTNADSGERFTLTGEEMQKGVTLTLDTPRTCCMYRIVRNK